LRSSLAWTRKLYGACAVTASRLHLVILSTELLLRAVIQHFETHSKLSVQPNYTFSAQPTTHGTNITSRNADETTSRHTTRTREHNRTLSEGCISNYITCTCVQLIGKFSCKTSGLADCRAATGGRDVDCCKIWEGRAGVGRARAARGEAISARGEVGRCEVGGWVDCGPEMPVGGRAVK
jgi:hypothetical protein